MATSTVRKGKKFQNVTVSIYYRTVVQANGTGLSFGEILTDTLFEKVEFGEGGNVSSTAALPRSNVPKKEMDK